MPLIESFEEALSASPQVASSSASSHQKRTLVGGAFSHLSSTKIDWGHITQQDLVSHSHGLCSSVYRRTLSPAASWPSDAASSSSVSSGALSNGIESADGLSGWVCIKRVAVDEQPRPHSISRELALLDLLPPHRNITPLLAAVYDTSDPFGAVVDLVMPLYAATLEEVLQEPSLVPLPATVSSSEISRPGHSIRHLWSESIPTFVHSIASQLVTALAFLHDNEVAHRDIKPSNILLSHNGVLKLIDLGTAFTTNSLKNPLPEEEFEEESSEKMVCQVGTGCFRAPELLFTPKGGYDAFAVDVWALAVVLSHFFTSLIPVPKTTTSEMPSLLVEEDDRKDWQRAFESDTPLPHHTSNSDEEGASPQYWEEDPLPESPSANVQSESGFIRTPLFQSERGDIGLAGSIFSLLGLPTTVESWPEAAHFQPPLERLPFAATTGSGLLTALPLFRPEETEQQLCQVVENVILPSLQLSAAARPKAKELLDVLSSDVRIS